MASQRGYLVAGLKNSTAWLPHGTIAMSIYFTSPLTSHWSINLSGGNFTTEQEHCVDPTGANPLAFTNGLYTFTAADGSTISGRYNGQLIPTETTAGDDLFMIEGRFTIEEGTGRFDGATGSGVADGLQNLTTGEASLVLDGTIAYPGLEPGGVGTPEASPAT